MKLQRWTSGLLLLIWLGCLLVTLSAKLQVHIAFIGPKVSTDDRYCYKSAAQAAAKMMNKDDRFLPHHELVLHFYETHGDLGYGLEALYKALNFGPKKAVFIGPAFSKIANPTSALLGFKHTLQISYAALDGTIRVPFFFSTTPSTNSFSRATVGVFRYFKWNKYALLYDYTDNLHYQSADKVRSAAKDMTLLAIEGFSSRYGDSVSQQMKRLKDKDSRIIATSFRDHAAPQVFCEIYKHKMYGAKKVWFVLSQLLHDWHTRYKYDGCTIEEILEAAEGHFAMERLNVRTDNISTITNMTGEEIFHHIKQEKLSMFPTTKSFFEPSAYAFDAVWSAGMALDAFDREKDFNISDYQYGQCMHTCYLMQVMWKNVKFEGITGPLRYERIDGINERLGEVSLMQFRNGSYHRVGIYRNTDNKLQLDTDDPASLFRGGYIIKDSPTIVRPVQTYSATLIAFMWGFAIIGILMASGFLIFNVRYNDVKVIKMSSPRINNAIAVGCMFCFLSVIIYGLDSKMIPAKRIPIACDVVVITLAVGFTLAFGALFSKTWRVYKIFTAVKTMERVNIQDFHLYGVIFVLLGIDVIVFVTWMIVDPFYLTIKEQDATVYDQQDIIEIPYSYRCKCTYQTYFTTAMYSYKGLLLLFGLFLAWETRNVKVAVLNDSKYIGMAVYNVAVLSSVGVVCASALYDTTNHESGYSIVAICTCICTTVTLLLVFVPKVKMLLRPGKDDTSSIGSRPSVYAGNSMNTMSTTSTNHGRRDFRGSVVDKEEIRKYNMNHNEGKEKPQLTTSPSIPSLSFKPTVGDVYMGPSSP